MLGVTSMRDWFLTKGFSSTFKLTNQKVIVENQSQIATVTNKITETLVTSGTYHIITSLRRTDLPLLKQLPQNVGATNSIIGGLASMGFSDWKARQIAVTTVQQAVGKARSDMANNSGVQYKQRVTIGDMRVRPKHAQDESYGYIPMTSPYPASRVMYVGEGIDGLNCRCVEQYTLDKSLVTVWDGGELDSTFDGYYEEDGFMMYGGKRVYENKGGVKFIQDRSETRRRNRVVQPNARLGKSIKDGLSRRTPDADPALLQRAIDKGLPLRMPSVFERNDDVYFDHGVTIFNYLIQAEYYYALFSVGDDFFNRYKDDLSVVPPNLAPTNTTEE